MAFILEVDACGKDGNVEMTNIRKLAPKVIKALVNYI